jgi:hypothetical protein
MKRIQEKVKDLVEVRKLFSLPDYAGNPAETLAAYHFTDATSELMSKWLDRVSSLQSGEGVACALAGYRGVGKSHFLATLGAIAGIPELRNKISDAHVAASAQGLLRRRYPIVNVRRGTETSLLDEFRVGVAKAFGLEAGELPTKVMDILALAKSRAGDLPLLILIDTAAERESRVTRDDGPLLAEIAETAKLTNALVAVALDDDIAGADGTNSAIVRSFTIDYLDQDHLYKVVDSFLFPKYNQHRHVLHDVYEYFREVMPSFRWSEQKFTALYPLHPVILEIAPFVRLFVQDFALLSFASEAGERILGRPANSLIALDEVFDSAENGLRKIDDLKDAFAAYDRLNTEVVAKIPVLQRLQAKLILKALLLLSLDGQGTTAADITAGMLIYDEKDAQKAYRTVEEIIRMFAAALPDDVRVHSDDGGEIRYGLKVSSKDRLNTELDDAAAKLDPTIVDGILHRLLHERFADSTFFAFDGTPKLTMECHLTWRGGVRRGKVNWGVTSNEAVESDFHDWEVFIDLKGAAETSSGEPADIPRVVWRPAALRRDETEAILRYHVLSTNAAIRENFGDMVRASLHSSTVVMARIVNRIFLEDGRLVIDDFDYNFNDDARVASTLSELFSTMLEPLFEARYPQHPYFLRRLGVGEVASLVSDLYSGSRQRHPEVQQLAQTFGLPLGVVKLNDGIYIPETEERLAALPPVEAILKLFGSSRTPALADVYKELKKPPYGYVREAQQLILSAMVSQRMIEFVTSKGDRINSRSLDLKIIWDDIVGIAPAHEGTAPSKHLNQWAKVFVKGEFKSFADKASSDALESGLRAWLDEWDKEAVLERFDRIPAEAINTFIWKRATRASNSLGSMASSIRSFLGNKIGLEDCVSRISEVFLNDVENFARWEKDLEPVSAFVDGYARSAEAEYYVSVAEYTRNADAENARDSLDLVLREFQLSPNDERLRNIGYQWAKFHRLYSETFVSAHDAVMRSHQLHSRVNDVLRGDDWWEFQNLVSALGAGNAETSMVFRLVEMARDLNCKADTAELLKSQPHCECGFSLSRAKEWESIDTDLDAALANALNSLKARLADDRSELISEITSRIETETEPEVNAAAVALIAALGNGSFPVRFPQEQLALLRESIKAVRMRREQDTLSADDAIEAVEDWFSDAPNVSETVSVS